jgi:hypothetical protein
MQNSQVLQQTIFVEQNAETKIALSFPRTKELYFPYTQYTFSIERLVRNLQRCFGSDKSVESTMQNSQVLQQTIFVE